MGFTEFYFVFTKFYLVLLGHVLLNRVLPSLTEVYWVFTRFYLVLMGFTEFLPGFT